MEYCLFRCDLVKRSWIGLCCGNCQSFFGKWWLFAFIWVSNFVLPTSWRTPQLSVSQSTPSKKREHIALHMLVCLSDRPSVCLSVCNLFLSAQVLFGVTISGGTGLKVKVTGVKCAKNISDCLSNNFPKWMSSSYIAQLILNWLIQLYKTSVTKKSFKGHIMFYKHLVSFKLLLNCC